MIPYGLHARISILMVGLLLCAFVSVLIIVDRADQRIAGREVDRGLQTGQRVFLELLERNRRQLEQAATVLSTDFGFREAVTSNDLHTVRSVLQNHGIRIRADVMMLASLDGPCRTIGDAGRKQCARGSNIRRSKEQCDDRRRSA